MQLWQKKNWQNFIFYIPRGEAPPKHKCVRAIAIMTFILLNTFKHYDTVYCQISTWYGHWFDNKLR